MNPQNVMAYALVGLLICNILTLVAIGVAGYMAVRKLSELTEHLQATIKVAQAKLDEVLQKARPVITNVENATHRLSDGVQSVKHIVGGVEDAVGTLRQPVGLISTVSSLLRLPSTKVGVLSLALGALARYQMHRHTAGKQKARPVVSVR